MGRARIRTREDDLIDLSRLPNEKIANKTRRILKAIDGGACYTQFKGKRLVYDRTQISVPVNIDFRIIYCAKDGQLKPLRVLSHEEYNGTHPGRKRN